MKYYLIGKAYGTAQLRIYRTSATKGKMIVKEYENGKIFNKTLKIIQADSAKDAKARYYR